MKPTQEISFEVTKEVKQTIITDIPRDKIDLIKLYCLLMRANNMIRTMPAHDRDLGSFSISNPDKSFDIIIIKFSFHYRLTIGYGINQLIESSEHATFEDASAKLYMLEHYIFMSGKISQEKERMKTVQEWALETQIALIKMKLNFLCFPDDYITITDGKVYVADKIIVTYGQGKLIILDETIYYTNKVKNYQEITTLTDMREFILNTEKRRNEDALFEGD